MKPGNGVGLYPTLNEKQSDSTLVNLNQTSGLSNLPADIITSISNFFDPKDLASLSATCRSFSSTWEYGKNIWYPAIENSYPYAKRLIPQEYIASNASSRFFHLLQSMFADSGFQLVRENEYKNIRSIKYMTTQ